MPINKKYLADFEENEMYHVYNRTNNQELLFLSDENRYFFLRKYAALLSPFISTYCWCLLPNHFHLLVRIKPVDEIKKYLGQLPKPNLTITEQHFIKEEIILSVLIEKTFTRFFQSYAQSFNKTENRTGNLFYKPFKRVLINNNYHFTQTVIYIHANTVKHGIAAGIKDYRWSSWHSILSLKPTMLLRNELLDWFGGIDAFVQAHLENTNYYYENDTPLDD